VHPSSDEEGLRAVRRGGVEKELLGGIGPALGTDADDAKTSKFAEENLADITSANHPGAL
jgi:hypothetical protein